jgi:hypothetical protein
MEAGGSEPRIVPCRGLLGRDARRRRPAAHDRTPMLGHYAELDYLITARVLKNRQLLGDKFTYHIYPTVPEFMAGGTGQIQPATGAQ